MLMLLDRFPVEQRLHRFILCTRRSGGTAYQGGGANSQLDPLSLTPLSVADYDGLQLGVPRWANSVDYCKQLIIDPTFCGSSFSTGRLLAIEDFTILHWEAPGHRRLYDSPLGGYWPQKTLPFSTGRLLPMEDFTILHWEAPGHRRLYFFSNYSIQQSSEQLTIGNFNKA